jgi:hypothetical protein
MRKRPFWSRIQPKLPRRKVGKFSSSRCQAPARTGLEGIEPRLLLSGSISVWGGTEGTEQIAIFNTPSRLDYTDFGAGQMLSFTKTVSLAGLAEGRYYVLAKIDLPGGNEWCSPLNNIVVTVPKA